MKGLERILAIFGTERIRWVITFIETVVMKFFKECLTTVSNFFLWSEWKGKGLSRLDLVKKLTITRKYFSPVLKGESVAAKLLITSSRGGLS